MSERSIVRTVKRFGIKAIRVRMIRAGIYRVATEEILKV